MKIEEKYCWKFKDMKNYIKKTHNKFFFVFKEKELEQIEKKIGIELNWTKIKLETGFPKNIENHFIILDFDRWHFAEIEKNDKNLKLLEKKLGSIPGDKDCFCSEGLYKNKVQKGAKDGKWK